MKGEKRKTNTCFTGPPPFRHEIIPLRGENNNIIIKSNANFFWSLTIILPIPVRGLVCNS